MHATDAPAVRIGGVIPRTSSLKLHAAVATMSVALPYIGSLAGVYLLTRAYAADPATQTGLGTFHLFWLGILAFLIPTAYRLLGFAASRGERMILVAASGAFLFVPKVLRDPNGPVYFDELAHWRQSEVVAGTGRLFEPNPIVHFAQLFPGLDSVDVALQRMTGLSTFGAAIALLATAHVVALLGVFRLGERVLGSARLGALAAVVYGLNTSFMFFDSQYSYESLAIVFFIWAVTCIVEAVAVRPGPARLGWVAAALVSGVACVVTHHLTSYAMLGAFALMTIAAAFVALRGHGRGQVLSTLACVGFALAASALIWAAVVTPDIVGYFSPAVHRGIEQLTGLAHHSGGGARQLFSKSTTPGYEQKAAYLAPTFAFLLAVTGLWALRRRLFQDAALLGLTAFGAVYFVSLPFILTQSGAEGARRSWAFTSLGLCLLVAVGLAAAAGWARRLEPTGARMAARLALTVVVAVIAVGNVAMGVNVNYRFPGPFAYGSDARALTAETQGAAGWMKQTTGPGQRLIADRDTGLAFGTIGGQWIEKPWENYPLWEFFLKVRQPDAALLDRLRRAAPRYLVVDERMAEQLPATGIYLAPEEPGARRHTKPAPLAALAKYPLLPWAIQIFASDHYRIYRLDLDVLGTCSDTPRHAFGGPDCRGVR
jgi:hypothetical protein